MNSKLMNTLAAALLVGALLMPASAQSAPTRDRKKDGTCQLAAAQKRDRKKDGTCQLAADRKRDRKKDGTCQIRDKA